MKAGDKIGIVCCSNGLKKERSNEVQCLGDTLLSMGLCPVFSDLLYAKDGVPGAGARGRAEALMDFYADNEIKAIFDISGGDIANGILPFLDYEVIAGSRKMFWGYSDLTTVINAVYARTGKTSVLYSVRNLIRDRSGQQNRDFRNTVMEGKEDLFRIKYRFIRRHEMEGIVTGGNIRCFLKLAGTEFMPDLTDKILLLESFRGTEPQMEAYLCQLEQMGVFRKAAGILLGTFTQMEAEGCRPDMETLIQRFAGSDLPIAVTRQIGHGSDAKGILIGRKLRLTDD